MNRSFFQAKSLLVKETIDCKRKIRMLPNSAKKPKLLNRNILITSHIVVVLPL
ncbi:hypothetical protein ACFLYZ_00510 [Thermodesulfobacteriota bacterium]